VLHWLLAGGEEVPNSKPKQFKPTQGLTAADGVDQVV
jgi:hypothetical protein